MMNNEHKPVLIVIAGPNDSGKTTITSKILKHEWRDDAVYINPDEIAQNRFGDWNSVDAVMKAAKYCTEKREQCLEKHQNLNFETVMSIDSKVDFIRRSKEAGYFVRLFLSLQIHRLSMLPVLRKELWKAVMMYQYKKSSLAIIDL